MAVWVACRYEPCTCCLLHLAVEAEKANFSGVNTILADMSNANFSKANNFNYLVGLVSRIREISGGFVEGIAPW